MGSIKIGKADSEDIDKTRDFLRACESLWDSRSRYSMRSKEEEWERWDDDDKDKILLLKIRKELAAEEHCSPEDVDNRLIIYEFIKQKYQSADIHWNRVVLAADILIDNVCDPTENHLSFYPGLEIFHVSSEQ